MGDLGKTLGSLWRNIMLAKFGFGPLELDVLQRLWTLKTATVRHIYKIFLKEDRDIAYSTVLTVMKNLERKGVVEHTVEGRTFVYTAKMPEQKVKRDVIPYVVDKAFDGDVGRLAAHLADCRRFSPKDTKALCDVVEASDRRAQKRKAKK